MSFKIIFQNLFRIDKYLTSYIIATNWYKLKYYMHILLHTAGCRISEIQFYRLLTCTYVVANLWRFEYMEIWVLRVSVTSSGRVLRLGTRENKILISLVK
jgi:hypothetical protein